MSHAAHDWSPADGGKCNFEDYWAEVPILRLPLSAWLAYFVLFEYLLLLAECGEGCE